MDLEYLYPLGNVAKAEPSTGKSKFVLRWHSQSPTEQQSYLDQSELAVEVFDQDQFFEILCTHAIVDHNNCKISTPRFTAYLIDAVGAA